MALFSKKKEKENGFCCNIDPEKVKEGIEAAADGNSIKVLGSGCKKCAALEDNTKQALVKLGMAAEVEHISDFSQIAAYGVMTTPALVVGSKLVSYGKVPSIDEIAELITNAKA